MHPVLKDLLDLLTLERIEDNIFRGESRDIGSAQVFGEQVLGQALTAAHHTVAADRRAHSLHAYFLRRGDMKAESGGSPRAQAAIGSGGVALAIRSRIFFSSSGEG